MAPAKKCCKPANVKLAWTRSNWSATTHCSHCSAMATIRACFPWELLYKLGAEQDALWQRYLGRLAEAGVDRDAPMVVAAAGCGHSH